MARILIVDDEITNLEVAEVICHAAGHTTVSADNGLKALELLLAGEVFDLVLLDCLMPVMDGITMAEKLRADPRFATLPILGVTAKASHADRSDMMHAGFDAVLTKPFRNKTLIEAMNQVLAGHSAPSL